MNRSGLKSVMVISILLIGTLSLAISELCYAEVVFPDLQLEASLRDLLAKPQGAFTKAELAEITHLDLRDQNITTIAGLEYCINLESLNLRDNDVTDISLLGSLTGLKYLNLHSNTNIESLAPLANLTRLETLIMRNVPVGNQLNYLENMTYLKRLNVNNTQITDLNVLADLMAQGTLQDDWVDRTQAEVDIGNNPIYISAVDGTDGFAPIRDYWHQVGKRTPHRLAKLTDQKVVINEVMTSNGRSLTDRDEEPHDWLELYNLTDRPIDLSAYYLSDDVDNLHKWQLPFGTIIEPQGFLLIWASGKDSNYRAEIHTNFSLARQGETVVLTAPDGITIVDYFPIPQLGRDMAYGRLPDGTGNLSKFAREHISPAKSNNSAKQYTAPDSDLNPVFSRQGGFYKQPFLLELQGQPDTTIYYTLDGSLPDPEHNPENTWIYSAPLEIKPQVVSPGRTYRILSNNVPQPPLTYIQSSYNKWYLPVTDQFRGTVIRAKAYSAEGIDSEVITHTYFIDEQGFRHTMPVVAITVDPIDFFDYETGIYLPGRGYHEHLPWAWHHWGSGNFHGRGSLWERPIHIEFWENDGSLAFAQNAGVRMHGDASRAYGQKSLRIIASSDYDLQDSFDHEIFPGRTKPFTDDDQSYDQFKTLILRNGGNTWENTMFKDGLLQNLLQHTNLDIQYFRPAIVYLNGEYWGIHNIRDRFDEWYLHYTYGVDPRQVEMFKDNVFVNEGNVAMDDPSRENYRQLLKIINPNYAREAYPTYDTLSDPEQYAKIKQLMDIDHFLDYAAVQVYIQNFDWPGNNIRAWRLALPENDLAADFGYDGRWRWMVFDLDLAFSDVHMNNLANATREAGTEWHNQSWATFLLRSLMQSEEFCLQFINRSADHINTTFLPEVVIKEIDRLETLMEPEIEEHIRRWNKPAWSVHHWHMQNNMLRIFAMHRPAINQEHIRQYFNLDGVYKLTLSTEYAKGYIQINSIEITPSTPGVNNPNNWQGTYYKNVPITLTAVPHLGFEFAYWLGVPQEMRYQDTITITPDASLSITAVFQ